MVSVQGTSKLTFSLLTSNNEGNVGMSDTGRCLAVLVRGDRPEDLKSVSAVRTGQWEVGMSPQKLKHSANDAIKVGCGREVKLTRNADAGANMERVNQEHGYRESPRTSSRRGLANLLILQQCTHVYGIAPKRKLQCMTYEKPLNDFLWSLATRNHK